MYFSGYTFKSIPKTPKLTFGFSDIYLTNPTGIARIGFSGNTSDYSLLISGGKVYDEERRFIYSYAENFDVSGIIQASKNQLFIDGVPLKIKNGSPGQYSVFYVDLSGTELNTEVYIYTPQINHSVGVSPAITPLGDLSIVVQNSSELDFSIYGYNLQFTNNNNKLDEVQFSGVISGVVSGNLSREFILSNTTDIQDDRTYVFDLTLDTNFGQITKNFSVRVESGYNSFIYKTIKLGPDISLSTPFFGTTGLSTFTFESVDSEAFSAIQVGKFGLMTERYYSGEGDVLFEPLTPNNDEILSSEYVTNIEITATGIYDACPNVKFTEYYYVKDLTLDSNTILSTGCTGIIRILFSGISGVGQGASGYLLRYPSPNMDQVLYGSIGSPQYYYSVSGATISGQGTGFIESPYAYLDFSEAGAGCYDYAEASGDKYPYSAFSGTPIMGRSAGYLTGQTVCEAHASGYYVTGVRITNPGSGYSSTFYPYIQFIRSSGDTQTDDASGVIHLNTGQYPYGFYQTWRFFSGVSSEILSDITIGQGQAFLAEDYVNIPDTVSGFLDEPLNMIFVEEFSLYSGHFNYGNQLQPIYFKIALNPIDYTGNMVCKFTVSHSGGSTTEYLVTGSKLYSEYPYLLLNDVGTLDSATSDFSNFFNSGFIT